MNYKIQHNNYTSQIDQPLVSSNNGSVNYGIPVRDRFTDIFAYFPSDERIYTGIPGQYDDDINNDNNNDDMLDEPDKNNKKLVSNILNTLNKSNLRPEEAEFIYAEILDSKALITINNFKNIISNPYLNMKINHIDKLEMIHGCKLIDIKSRNLNSKDLKIKKKINRKLRKIYLQNTSSNFIRSQSLVQPLTDYKFYLRRILEHKIEIPDRFDISYAEPYSMNSSYLPIKIIARYYKRIINSNTNSRKSININNENILDNMSITLIDLHSVRSKTMFAFHISKSSKKDGIIVLDQYSFSLNTAINNSNMSQYLINYGTTKNYNVYTFNNPLDAMIYHISYALLEPDLRRIMFYSVRQILDMVEIMAEYSDKIKTTMLEISNIKDSDLFAYSHLKSEMSNIIDHDIHTDTELLDRIIHVSDILYCIKESYSTDNKIISECIKSIWPKLNMIGCEITGSDKLYLNIVNNLLSAKLNGITIYSPVFALPETVVGYNLECKSNNSYILNPSSAYFEFIPINDEYFTTDKVDISCKSFRHLKKNKLYELVVSSYHTDTVRMATGSIIKIDSYLNAVPVIIPICREIELIYSRSDILTRIISPEDIELIMLDSDLLANLTVKEYCFRKENTCYKFYIELDRSNYIEHKSTKSTKSTTSTKQNTTYSVSPKVKESRLLYRLSRLLILDYDLDKKMQKLNNKSITSIEIRIVNPETFSKIIEMRTVDTIDVARLRMTRRIEDLHEISILKKEITYQFT
jgi:hypothetical protein